MWTPPHFWALALFTRDDYARAGIPMMPNVAGDDSTRRQILVYAALLAPIGALPWLLGHAGPAYGVAALLLGARVRPPRLSSSGGAATPTATAPPSASSAIRSSISSGSSACGSSKLALGWTDRWLSGDGAPRLLTPEQARRRRRRSVALALLLARRRRALLRAWRRARAEHRAIARYDASRRMSQPRNPPATRSSPWRCSRSSPAWSACPSPRCRSTASSARSPAMAARRSAPTAGADRTLDREIVVRFDANVAGLPLGVPAGEPAGHVKLGETALVNFIAENTGSAATDGHGDLQRPAGDRRRSTSTRSSASASPSRRCSPASGSRCRCSSSSRRTWPTTAS